MSPVRAVERKCLDPPISSFPFRLFLDLPSNPELMWDSGSELDATLGDSPDHCSQTSFTDPRI